jgi:NADH-quinone oxidoreductase subunit J
MITAIGLTLRERKDTKKVDASRQIRVRARDRVEVVKLNPTQAPVPVVAQAVTEEPKK